MATAINELTYLSFPISKFEKNDEGDLIVVGKATDGSVDSDEQIVSPEWSAKALSDWIDTGGNLRVQHQAMRDPAGKGLSVELDKDGDGGHWVKSLVVEPVAKRLVEKGVLTAYSVGIARPVITRDPSGKARGGIVTGGSLAELSLVDRPANKNCGLMIAKAASGAEGEMEMVGEVFGDPEFLAKASTEDDLLAKNREGDDAELPVAASGAGDSGDLPVAQEDSGEDDGNPGGETGDPADDVISRVVDLETAGAYKAERARWLAAEPSVKGIAGGTEYLAKVAEWKKWGADGEAEGLDGTQAGAERWLAKRDFSASQRDTAADSGAAMKDGSFPIKNGEDLGNAIGLAGNAKNPAAARAHIKRRAAALGMSDKIPDTWKTEGLTEVLAKRVDDGLMLAEDARKEMGAGDEGAAKAVAADGTVGDSKDSTFASGSKECGTCKGSGKIKDGNMDCPACNGKGKMPAGKKAADAGAEAVEDADIEKKSRMSCGSCGKTAPAGMDGKFCSGCGKKMRGMKKPGMGKKAARMAAVETLAVTVTKSVADGLITQEAGDEIIAQAVAEIGKSNAPLPGDTRPVGTHREPDGGVVENAEPTAGLPTDPDPVPDKVPASTEVASMSGKAAEPVPYTAGRMHDILCAAYDPAEALAGYPTLKTVTDGIDEAWFTGQATEALAGGDAPKAIRLTGLVQAAQAVKAADPAAVADASAELHKAFTDMYPAEHCSPSDPPRPGTYQRPYLTAGHASENAAHNGGPNIPSSSHTPEPEQFRRPLITDGHEAGSPANKDAGDIRTGAPVASGSAGSYYSSAQRGQARVAMQNMHDHLSASFPMLCPMAASKSVIPPGNGAENVPHPVTPADQGGVPAVGKTDTVAPAVKSGDLQALVAAAVERYQTRLGSPAMPASGGMSRKQLAKAAGRLGYTLEPAAEPVRVPVSAPAGLTAADMKALLAEQITPLAERYDTQLNELRKQLDEIGAEPNPALAPVRGALAKAPLNEATPVERRSLVDEAAVVAAKRARAEDAHYREYVQTLSKSPDPGVRESAMAVLDKMAAPAAAAD